MATESNHSTFIPDLNPLLNHPLLLTLTTSTILLLLFHPIYNAFFHPLSRLPGPLVWSTHPLFYTLSLSRGHLVHATHAFHAKYGPVVRIAPGEVSLSTAEAWSKIYASGKSNFPKSPYWFQRRPNGAYGILAAETAEHGRFRRAFSGAFTEKRLGEREGVIDRHAGLLIEKLRGEEGKERTVNVTDELEFVAFDIAGEFAFSRSFECVTKEANRGQVQIVQLGLRIFTFRALKRILGINGLSNFVGNLAMSVRAKPNPFHNALAEWTRSRLDDAFVERETRDLVDYAVSGAKKGKELSLVEAENAIGDFMMAGTEAVATVVVAALYYLTKDEGVMRELRKELKKAGVRSPPFDFKVLAECRLLNAVVEESMRLAPGVPTSLPRTVPAGGVEIGGYFIPEGTTVSINQFAAYRNPAYFEHPDKFLPHRWIDPGSLVHDPRVFLPFSQGPRSCIGKPWALKSTRAVLASFVANFDMKRAGGEDYEWGEQDAFFVWQKKDLNVKLTKLRD